jgi:hypothetical protein
MKHVLWIAIVVAAACSAPANPGPTTLAPAPAPGPAQEPVPADPTQADTGLTCDKEIAIRCRAPGVDGCDTKRTTHHVCVAQDAVAGPPCSQELAQVCPAGQVDACLQKPQVAANHICVLQ